MAEQSTRYCNYSKNKFDNEITINLPTWAEEAGFDGSQDPGDYRLEDMCADSWKWQSMNPNGYND